MEVGRIKRVTPQPLKWLEALLQSEQLRGQSGADGAQGERGLRGECGERGERGLDGSDGQNGVNGQDGLPGKRGERGETGLQGVQGLRGERGEQGEQGLAGIDGADGQMGARGPRGAKGERGLPPKHQIDRDKGTIRFERPQGGWGEWLEIKQIVKTEVYGGGGGGERLTKAVSDIEALRSGTFADYQKIVKVVANTTLTDKYRYIKCKTNAVTVTLPPAATYYNAAKESGIVYSVANDKSNANNCILKADGSELIDDVNQWTIPPGATIKVITDGTEWDIV